MPRTPTRLVTGLLAAALGAAALTATAAPATAAPVAASAAPCTVTTVAPARVSIDRAFQEVPVTLRTTCADLAYADVFLVGPDGDLWDAPYWDPAVDRAVYPWEVYGDNVTGAYRTEDMYVDPEDTEYTATYSSTLVRFGSKVGLTGTRAGSQVRLTACASYYNGRRDAFVPWASHRATIQKLGADGRTWEFVRTVTTGSNGCGTHTVTSAAAGTYRVTTYETYQIFSRTSGSVRV